MEKKAKTNQGQRLRFFRANVRNKRGDVTPAEEAAASVAEAIFHFENRFGHGCIVDGPTEFERDPRDERPLL